MVVMFVIALVVLVSVWAIIVPVFLLMVVLVEAVELGFTILVIIVEEMISEE